MERNNGIIERTAANGSTYSSNFFTLNYDSSTASDGLPNYNNSKYLNITKLDILSYPKKNGNVKVDVQQVENI